MALDSNQYVYELPPLPFPASGLPGISATTLEFHHGRHHAAYVARLNALIAGSPLRGRPLEEVVASADGALFNNAAQAWNHAFYWNCLSPEAGLQPSGSLRLAIDRDFGALDQFHERFRASAVGKFGSGWTWLVIEPGGRLAIETTDDADTPLRHGRIPLLTCDVWEHAYYLDYKNERPRYVDAFLKLINWQFVQESFAAEPGSGPAIRRP